MPPQKLKSRKSATTSASRIIFVLGGSASGKSETALQLAGSKGPRAFVATGQGLDAEMAARIARHQATRAADWETAEVPLDLAAWFTRAGSRYRTIVLDCVTLWLSNLRGSGMKEPLVLKRVAGLLEAMRKTKAKIVIVSNELGLGLVPAEPTARAFRDLAGRVNQVLAAGADEAHLVVSGIPLRLK
ncbi:bifunctional adenosylcobinamide kinase/adenosylcobinamide-phosphate guanylyltransferase [Nitrospira lenta]|uniref:Adenosylcobinamide kinase n=1 Tax=Nitrospira lenta TaxID=1436998 RepID=A0A330LH10_9BACT|nr:bifunctional adenosylcobinamide kinase/adenosylcobinamide-phosphate guanylyltransferase [Nitrospira lenta]SPP66473.1 Bifunctional adenosylcobalamin biosynthesis protein CobU [Nitrospira lenta]